MLKEETGWGGAGLEYGSHKDAGHSDDRDNHGCPSHNLTTDKDVYLEIHPSEDEDLYAPDPFAQTGILNAQINKYCCIVVRVGNRTPSMTSSRR